MTSEFNKFHGDRNEHEGLPAARETLRHASYGDVVKIPKSRSAGRVLYGVALGSMFLLPLAGCGLPSLTSGIGGGLFGGGNASKTENQPLTKEQMLIAAKGDGPMAGGADTAGGCPRFQVFPRDHHVTIYETGKVGDGLAVVHRGEITQTARECQVEGGRVTVKYGFSGRVLLGPRGRNGTVTLPVAVFVADAKRERILNDKLTIDVVIGADKPIGYFSAVRTVTFPVAEGARAGEYDIFVGFDQKAPGAG